MSTLCLNAEQIDLAASLLKNGDLVAFPTETVYGLGAPIFSAEAVGKIFVAKGRPSDNPLIAHISNFSQIDQIAISIPPLFYRLAEVFFPGPLTVVLRRHPDVPSIVSAGLDTIAVRMPAHPLAKALIEKVGQPLVAPSANLSGRPSATRCEHVLEDFQGKIAAVIDGGQTQLGIESTVISLLGEEPVVLRPGSITSQEIAQVLGSPVRMAGEGSNELHASPGTKHRHYAPETPISFFRSAEALQNYRKEHPLRRCLLLSRLRLEMQCDHLPLSASQFYAYLRHADAHQYDEILIYCDETVSFDLGLMNRIIRAAQR